MRKPDKHSRAVWGCVLAAVLGLLGLGKAGAVSAADEIVALKAGRIVTVTRGILEPGVILIKNGVIEALGADIPIPAGARVIDASKSVVLPGFIDAFTNLGTSDVATVERDDDEATSPVTPHLRIIDSFDPGNAFIPAARRSGVTSVLAAPSTGNLLSGQSAVLRLEGNDASAMAVKFPAAVHANLGESPKLRYGAKGRMPMTRMGEAALLRQTLLDARAYGDALMAYEKKLEAYKEKAGDPKAGEPSRPAADAVSQSLLPVLAGRVPLVVSAERLDDILTAFRIAGEFSLRIILAGGADAYKVKEKLAALKIPVILKPRAAYRLTVETGTAVAENAALLYKAGVKIAFQTGSIANVGDLAAQARMAVAAGLPYEAAFRALTRNAAEIFGVEDRIGSLEKGKLADIVVFDQDPILRPARLEYVIISGMIEDMRGRSDMRVADMRGRAKSKT